MNVKTDIFKAIQVTDRVWWVGAIDWDVRDFHGYKTSRGSTYNAYLMIADKVILVDTVKAPFKAEMLSRIASVVNPGRIDYIISNHSEMDHSGCLPEVIDAVQPEKVFASVMGTKALKEHFHMDREIVALKDGEGMNLGGVNLVFYETRMLHWPDSMFTYLPDDGLLFSQDAFGMHLASEERFADELSEELLRHEAAKYYANILLPFSPFVSKLIKRVKELGIAIRIVAPDHGPVWRKNVASVLERYEEWAAQRPACKAVVVYDTMWGSTDLMARAIGDGLRAGGVTVRIMPLRSSHRSDVATELLDAGALLVGSPTINNTLFPTVADALYYLKGLRPRNLIGASFGSYGWGGGAMKEMHRILDEMKVELVDAGISVRYVPDHDALARCVALGEVVAEKLKEKCHGL